MVSKILRFLVALLLIATASWQAYWHFSSGASNESKTTLTLLLSAGLFILGIILISPELSKILSAPLTSAINAIYLNEEKLEKPPLNFKLAQYYTKEERFDEAIEEYEKLLKFYPKEVIPIIEIAKIQSEIYHEFDQCEQLLTKAIKKHPEVSELTKLLEELPEKKQKALEEEKEADRLLAEQQQQEQQEQTQIDNDEENKN